MSTPKAIGNEAGTVRVVIGEVKIIGADGVARSAQAGDRVFLNETLATGADGLVQLTLMDGRLLDLGHDSSMLLDAQLLAVGEGALASPAVVDVAALQAAIAAGADPSKVAEPTAAGAPAAGGVESGGGHTSVTIEQADSRGEVTAGYPTQPASIGFPSVELETGRVIITESNEPPVVESGLARVSEEGLPGAIPDTAGTADTTNASLVIGAIAVADVDQDLLSVTLSAPQTALSSNGVPITWSGDGTNTLVGVAGESTIVTITIDTSGRYVVRLSGPIDHADTAAEDYELFDVAVKVSDGQAVATGALTVAIEDDAPVVNVGGNVLPVLSVDETYLATDIASADFSGVFTTQFGADGAGGVRYALDVVGGDGRASGLTDTVTGEAVVLVTHGDAVEGRVGSAEGALAFTVVLNPATGAVTLDQLRALAHADATTTNEAARLDVDVLRLIATATDADGDRHNAAVDLGGRISFLDDGPAIAATGENPVLAVDETYLATDLATADFSTVFTAQFGADGAGGVRYALDVVGGDGRASGLTDTATGEAVVLVTHGDAVEGRVGSAEGVLAFTVVLNAATGELTLDQLRALAHADAATTDEAVRLDTDVLRLIATATDADGDRYSAAIDLGDRVSFLDDGPNIAATGEVPVLAVDETYLATDIANADFSGVFTAQFGADGAGGVSYVLDVVGGDGRASGLTDSATGEAVVLVTHGDAVEGRVGSIEGGLAFTVVVNAATGEVTLDQLRALAHADAATTDEAVKLDPDVLRLVATATDADGDLHDAAIDLGGRISFLDDGPAIAATGEIPLLAVDETYLTTDLAIADFSAVFAAQFGADGAGGVRYALDVVGGDGRASGLTDTATGEAVVLVSHGETIEGRVGSTEGALAFTVVLNPATGEIALDQLRALAHAQPGTTDEAVNLDGDVLRLIATATDADGDRHSASIDLGNRLSFMDDGPSIAVTGEIPVLAVDETYLATDLATADFSAAFTAHFGADGAGGVNYALDVIGGDGRASGLTDTATGETVVLVTQGDAIEGRVGSTEGALAFTLVLNPATGEVTLDQLRALAHVQPGTTNEAVSLDAEVLRLIATATDADGDRHSAAIDLGDRVSFLDDGPHIAVTGEIPVLAVDETYLFTDLATADFSAVFTAQFGADGVGGVRYALDLVDGDGRASGLTDTATGEAVVLVSNGDTVEGRVGSGEGALAFTVVLNPATGEVALDQLRALAHADAATTDEAVSLDTGALRLVATATDADGDSHHAAIDLGDRVSFYDDGPEIVLPAAATVSNMAAATATAALDFDFSIGDNTGADQPGSVAFSALQDGKDSGLTSAGQPIYLYVSDDGKTLTGSTAAAEDDVAAANSVFTLAINQGGAGNDTYTVTMLGTVDNGSGIEFNDLSGTGPAGNPPWKVVESGIEGRDLLFTPAGTATSVNSDVDDVGVDSQFIDWAKGLRIDFADFNVTGKHADLDYDFGPQGHYTVNHVSFAINQISNGAVADVTVKAFDADEDDPVPSALGDDAQRAITQVQVYDAAQNLVAVATDDGTVGGIDFDFNSDAAGGVTIRGLGEGHSVVTTTAEGYDRIEILNAGAEDGDGKFSISDLEVLTVDTGEPVSTGFDVTLTDADGDSTAGLVSVTFEPVGFGDASDHAGDTAPFAAGGDDAASAAAGGDVLVSGPAPSSFGDTDGDQGESGVFGADDSAPAAEVEPVDLNALLDGALPRTSSAAELEGYVTLDTETSPGSTIVLVDPSGGGDYQPLVTLNDISNLTLQELLDNQHLVVN